MIRKWNIRQKSIITFVVLTFFFTTPILAGTMTEFNNFSIKSETRSNKLNSFSENPIEMTIPYDNTTDVLVDGIITFNEYNETFKEISTDIIVYWQYDNLSLAIALESPYTGWVAIGFGPSMTNSNIIFGGSKSGSTYCYDMTGIGYTIEKDINKGGSNDIIECVATENSKSTILEFKIPMTTNDILDSNFSMLDTIGVFFGYHTNDDDLVIHDGKSKTYKTMFRPDAPFIIPKMEFKIFKNNISQGALIQMSVTLLNDINPIYDVNVKFYMNPALSKDAPKLILFETKTDINGKASFNYTNENIWGERTFGAVFELGFHQNVFYMEAKDTVQVNIINNVSYDLTVSDIFIFILTGTIVLAIFFVYLIYGYACLSLYKIYKNRNYSTKEENKDIKLPSSAVDKSKEVRV